jgi:hypothetical protein
MDDLFPTSSPKAAPRRARRAASWVATAGASFASCVTLSVWSAGAIAGSADAQTIRCIESNEGSDAAVTDCMRPGRHIRVDTSISRGTASLRERVDGFVPAAAHADVVGVDRHLHVRDVPGAGGFASTGFFGR